MINYIFISKEGHKDDVSYFEGFLVDSILTRRIINMGYKIFQHMKKCTDNTSFVLPYGMFITKIMKAFDVKLRGELEIQKLKGYHIYNIATLGCMKFELMHDEAWRRKDNVQPEGMNVLCKDEEGEEILEKGEEYGQEGSGLEQSIPQ